MQDPLFHACVPCPALDWRFCKRLLQRERGRKWHATAFLWGIYNPEGPWFNNAWIHGTSNIPVFLLVEHWGSTARWYGIENSLCLTLWGACAPFATSANNPSMLVIYSPGESATQLFIYSFNLHQSEAHLTLCAVDCNSTAALSAAKEQEPLSRFLNSGLWPASH